MQRPLDVDCPDSAAHPPYRKFELTRADGVALRERAATAWLFSLVGGALMAVFGLFVTKAGFDLLYPRVTTNEGQALITQGMIIAAAGLLVLLGSAAFYFMPDQRRSWAALVVALSILGWLEAVSFAIGQAWNDLYLAISIGPVLGLTGGLLGAILRPAQG